MYEFPNLISEVNHSDIFLTKSKQITKVSKKSPTIYEGTYLKIELSIIHIHMKNFFRILALAFGEFT